MIMTVSSSGLHAQYGPQQCFPASLNIYTSQSSVAVGEEIDLYVDITNSSDEIKHSFFVVIGYIDDFFNPQQLPTTDLFRHFQLVDSHHPSGRVFPQIINLTNSLNRVSSLTWMGYEPLSHEWIYPGQTKTLRLRLRAIGEPGQIVIPVQFYDNIDCDYSTSTTVTITEGSLPGPLLIQKTLFANDLYDCVRLGDELMGLWHIKNTSNEDRLIRFYDPVPGYLFNGMHDSQFRNAYLVSPSGETTFAGPVVTVEPDGEFADVQGVIFLPAGWSVYFSNFYDVSGYAVSSALQSTFSVWEIEADSGPPAEPPNDAYRFTNPAVPVCTPILTKTTVGGYCGVREDTELTYQVDIDRIIMGSFYAYTILEDLHSTGTHYVPMADPNAAGPLYEFYVEPKRTMWAMAPFYDDGTIVPFDPDASDPPFSDRMRLVYTLGVDQTPEVPLENVFNIRVGSSNYIRSLESDKVVSDSTSRYVERKPGDYIRRTDADAPKLVNGGSFDVLLMFFNAAPLVQSASHTLEEVCNFIDGYKYNDLNGNGVRDAGEPGVESWMITAQSGAGTFTAVTDAEGYYRIEGLPDAVWQVREAFVPGWVQSAPGGEGFYNVQLGAQVRSARLDFGNWRFAEISGTKYHDLDGSGRRSDGEPGVEGVRIELRDLNGQVLTYTYTDGAGRYGFAQVPPGHYSVNEDRDMSTRQSQPGPAEGGFHYVVATSGGSYPGRDFGNYMPIEINGSVVRVAKVTTDDPTVRDFRELKVQLVRTGPDDGAGDPAKVASEPMVLGLDEDGAFGVDGLQPGNWLVSVVLAEYWSAVSRNPVQVLVTSGFSATVLFEVAFDALAAPEVRTSSITGSVFRNTTGDHLYQKSSDVLLAGQQVRLTGRSARGAQLERTAVTGADGSYTFAELPAGEYLVAPAGVADSLRVGWPWSGAHRVVLGEGEHAGSSFAAHAAANPPMAVDADLAWTFATAAAYANLSTRLDDDGDARSDRNNFFSGPAALARTSAPGARPLTAAHTRLQMAGTDSLGRTILANSPAGGSVATVVPGAGAPGQGGASMGTWRQGLDLVFVLEGGPWYGPTASSLSNAPAVVAVAGISQWLSLHTPAEFAAQPGSVPVVRDPQGTPVAGVLAASYVLTPGPDFGLTPRRFDAKDDGDDDGGTGGSGGGIGTNDPGDGSDLPADFRLGAAFPNPFNPATVVPFELAGAGPVRLAVYDVTGRQVAVLVDATMNAGRHTVAWDASGLPSGVYIVRLTAGGKVMTGKATLLK